MASFSGGSRNDFFSIGAGQLRGLQVKGGKGYDTLRITGSNDVTVTSTTTAQWRELEAIDLSTYKGALSLSISPTLLSNSETKKLDITVSETSRLTLSATTGGVNLAGSGEVHLANGSNSIVSLASANVRVIGGSGADQITASTFGNRLEGGAGADKLTGNNGADVFVHGIGDGSDTVFNFNATQDRFDFSGHAPLNFFDLQQAMAVVNGGTLITLPDGSVFLAGVSPGALTAENFQQDGQQIAEFGAVVRIEAGTSAATINDILARVPAGTTLLLADGVHHLDAALVLNRGDITLSGESRDGTVLEFALPPGVGGNFITVGEGAKTYLGTTALDAAAGASGITLKDAAALQVGEVIYLYQPNTADYLLANGWNNVTMEEAASRPFREFITTVTAIDGNGVTLADPLPYDFAATETRAFTMDVLANVVLKDFTVTSVLGTADAHAFTNTLPGFDGASAITAQGTIGLTLLNLTITDSPSTALSLQSSIHAAVTDVVISGSHNKGSDGNGYGVLLSEAFNNDFSGLSITDMRHAVVFSAWNAETGNSIGVADTNRDVNFHGSPDVGNVVTVTNAILDYDTTVDPSVWSLVSGGGSNHAATDIASNAVRFFHGEGSGNVDTIHGADGGSYLNGHGSNDVLVGGNGDDMIVGGLRRDLLTGGDGADTFLFKMGDDLDTITDMDFSAGGDRIVIMGNVAVDGFEDLVFTQDGADLRVRYGSNSTIILKDTLRADVDAAHFVFDPQSSQFLDDWNGGL